MGELLAPVIIMCVFGILDSALKYSPPPPTQEPFLTLTDASGPLQCQVFGALATARCDKPFSPPLAGLPARC